MNEITLKERAKRLTEINEIVKLLDPNIRQPAFLLLQDYVLATGASEKENPQNSKSGNNGTQDRESFFTKFDHDKPSDNVLLVSAYFFSQYGGAEFSIDEIESIANEVGVTIPERPDMTLLKAQRDGKNLFCRGGRGAFRPTVHGEAFFKKTYQVSKGTRQKPEEPK
jgi:hypothetical protein